MAVIFVFFLCSFIISLFKRGEKVYPLEIGPYDRAGVGAYHVVDEWGFLTGTEPPGYGRQDCIGLCMEGYLTYNDKALVEAIWGMWTMENGRIVGRRHPKNDNPMSRDHFINTMVAYEIAQQREPDTHFGKTCEVQQKFMANFARFRISEMACFVPWMWFWTKYLGSKKRINLVPFYLLEFLTVLLIYYPLAAISRIMFKPEVDQEEWYNPNIKYIQNLPNWVEVVENWMPQAFSILQSGYILHVLPRTIPNRILRGMYWVLTGRTNYVSKLLFGGRVSRERVEAYRPMRGGRWSNWLNHRNHREMYVFNPSPPSNNVDRDLLRTLYNEKITK